MPLASIADNLGIPRSAAHRLLTDLCEAGYMRQVRAHGDYALTAKLVTLGLHYLSSTGVIDVAQPLLNTLAGQSGEFVRLGVIDGDGLTWVAAAQGAPRGLRYDPEMGMTAKLSCTATGHAWMLTMSDEKAVEMVAHQGFGSPQDYGPNAPTTVHELVDLIHAARERGFSMMRDTFMLGMTAMAAPIRRPDQPAIGVISIAGPSSRLTDERMLALGPTLLAAAAELADASGVSLLFHKKKKGEGHPVIS